MSSLTSVDKFPLLGNHKPSAEWYTPTHIWDLVYNTFVTKDVFDPCPIGGSGGLEADWSQYPFVYCNPPTPAASWATKALTTEGNSIIFAAFSEAVIWQVNSLLDYRHCWVRNRIRWIDGKTGELSKAPRNYNAFFCISKDAVVLKEFANNFVNLGSIRESYVITTN